MRPLRGITLKLISLVVFMAMSAIIKYTADRVPAGEAVFFRSAFAMPVIFVWLWWLGDLRDGLKTANPLGHLWRGIVGAISMGLGFAGLGLLPLPEVTALGYASPLLAVIFAAMFLGEEVRTFRLTAVALGLVGVLIVLSPRLTAFSSGTMDPRQTLGALVVLTAAVFGALAQVFVRKLVLVEKTSAIVFWFSFTASVLSLVTLPYGWVVPEARDAALLVAAGLLGGVGQILMTSSYRHADTAVIAPFDYASMLLALLVGYFLFDEVPTLVMLAGAALIVFAGIIIIWRESALGLERAKSRKSMTPQG
jgi:drug/metabolite transporter (DMT)-like permease